VTDEKASSRPADTGKTGKRRWQKWLAFPLLAGLVLLAGVVLLLATRPGFRFLVKGADSLAGGLFSVQEVDGRFFDSWQLKNVTVQLDSGLSLSLADLHFSWKLPALFDKTLQLNQLAVQGLELHLPATAESGEEDSPLVLPEIALPVDLQLREVQLQDGKIFFAGTPEPLVLNRVLLQAASRGSRVTVDRLLLDSPDYGADLKADVTLQSAWPLHISGSWRLADPGIGDMAGSLQAEGDLDSLGLKLGLKTPAVVRLNGKVTDILNNLHWQAAAETDHFHLKDIKVDVPVDGTLRISEAAGTIENYSGTLAATVHYQGYPQVEAEAKVAGDYSGLAVDYLRVLLDDSSLATRGKMDWSDGFSWQAELEGKQLDPSLAVPDWPGRLNFLLHSEGKLADSGTRLTVVLDSLDGLLRDFPLSGSGSAVLDRGTVTIEKLHVSSGTSAVSLSGTAAESVDLSFQAELADVSSLVPEAGGRIELLGTAVGSLDKTALSVTLNGSELSLEEYALAKLETSLKADLSLEEKSKGMTIDSLKIVLNEQATLNTSGQIGWADGISWQLALQGQELDPSLFAGEWPGSISTRLKSSGRLAGESLSGELRIEELTGELRSFPLSGSGRAELVDNSLTVEDLHLQSGSSQVRINGRAGSRLELDFSADSTDLASLLPGAGGSFQLQGTVNGSREQPQIALTLDGSGVTMDGYGLASLQARIKADLADNGTLDASLTADGITVQEEQVGQAKLQLSGSREKHQLTFSFAGAPGDLHMALAGSEQNGRWQGQLTSLKADTDQFGSWQTAAPVPIELAKTGCSISGFKLVQQQYQEQGALTLTGQWQQEQGWQVEAGLAEFSLTRLGEWGIPGPAISGQLSAAVKGNGRGAVPHQLDLSISLPELTLTTENEDSDGADAVVSWQWTDNMVKMKLEDGSGELTAHTLFQDGSETTLALKVKDSSGFTDPAAILLDGSLDINLTDLKPLAPLSNYMLQAKGGFGGTIAVQGSAANPTLNGSLALKDGEIVVPAAGLAIHELLLAMVGDTAANQVTLTIGAGESSILVEGQLSYGKEDPLHADFTIKGEDFRAVDLSEYQVLISPDLRLVYGAAGTTLSGRVTVPKARFAPTGFAGTVSSSRDVVVVDGEGEPEEKKLPISMDLVVVMGDEVAVDAFGVKGFLDGSLQIREKPGQIITGVGSLSLRDGEFAIKDTRLEISRGRVFYQGGSIDNPGLDVQAGKTLDDVEVGIRLSGQVDSMEMSLFSSPAMEDSEILSYLFAGKDGSGSGDDSSMLGTAAAALGRAGGGAILDNVEKGIGLDLSLAGGEKASDVSLVVGKQIHENLYISYGKGLTGEASKFKARYDLKYGFSVETEASSEATGTDIRWSTER
jgi:translocation and assembly module TamB